MAKIDEFRKQYPQYNDLNDEDVAKAVHAKSYSDVPFEEFRTAFIGPREQEPSLAHRVLDFVKAIPVELAKDAASVPQVPYDLIQGLRAQGKLEGIPQVDYASLRAQGLSHEDASGVMQEYINMLREASGELGKAGAAGQEHATRTAAAALSTAAGGGAGALAGKMALAPLARLALEGAAAGATHGGVTAAGQGAKPAEVGERALTGAIAGGVLGPAIPAAAKFVGREIASAGRMLALTVPAGRRAAQRAAQEALAGDATIHPAVRRLMEALDEAGPVREQQAEVTSRTRGRRFGRFAGVGQEVSGELGAKLQLAELRGRVPRVDFEALREKISQADVDELFNIIRTNPALREGEQARAYVALGKILGEEGGLVPQRNELELLQQVYGPKFVETLMRRAPLFRRARQLGVELVNIPRAIMSSMDLSAPFRQGAFLIGRPKQFAPAFTQMFKVLGDQRSLDALNAEIAARPTAPLHRAANLALSEVGGVLNRREEAFIGNIAEKIPFLGAGVRASQRGYVGFLNKLRADTFDDILQNAERMGHDVSDPRFIKTLGEFVNSATGRGALPGRRLENIAPELSTIFFSPRLIASRMNLLNPAFYAKLDPFVRKEALKSAMSAGAVGLSVLGLLKASGAKVETDPRSSDFGKVRIGDTRFDIFAGFQQYARLGAQLLPNFGTDLPLGGSKSPVTGRVTTFGATRREPMRPATERLKKVMDFMENKLAPVPSMLMDVARGKHRIPQPPLSETLEAVRTGQPVKKNLRTAKRLTPEDMAVELITPLAIRDALDAMAEWGPETGAYMAVPAFFGVGIQTMPSPRKQPSPEPGSLLDRVLNEEADSVATR